MTQDHKTSHKCQFFKTEIYRSYASWLNKLSIDVWFVRTVYLAEMQLFENGTWLTLLNILMIFGITEKAIIWPLAKATNITVWLKTGFVVQGHIYIYIYIYIYISGGPLSALTCCVNVRLLSAIKKISPLIYSQSWVGSWVYTTQAMMTFTLIF